MNKTYSLITGVLPSSSDHLLDCAKSINQLTIPPNWHIQWIVCADGTTEEAAPLKPPLIDIMQDAQTELIFHCTTRHVGTAAARNLALAFANGDLVRQLDADDLLFPDAIEKDILTLQNDHFTYCASGTVNLYEDGEMVEWAGTPDSGPIPQHQLYDWWAHDTHIVEIHTGAVCARTNIVRAVGGWMGIWPNEDTGLLLMLSEMGLGTYRKDPSMVYRFWEGASTSDFFSDTLQENPAFNGSAAAVEQRILAWRQWQARSDNTSP